jgi:cytosol alanyl aminopeptidase
MVSTELGFVSWLQLLLLCIISIMIDQSLARAEQTQIIRLDSNIIPLRYILNLVVDPGADAFMGDVEIEISVAAPSHHIVLHGFRLQFDVIQIKDEISTQNATASVLANDGTLALDFPREVSAGKASLIFKYHAAYSNGLEGLYKITDDSGASVFTQFQAIGARRAFPCFDEPGFKALYDVTITSPQKYKTISNTTEIGTTQSKNKNITHHFATTKPLPTYLVALAVGDFDVVTHLAIPPSKLRTKPIPLRGIAMRGRGDELKSALDVTAKLLLAEEDYFGIAYPFDKLDIIAVPDFGAGGMENAGAITYEENLVLLDDDATLQRRREFLTTHAHEIAHQWFGNLVTPKWWDDLWLNESFASLMETKFAGQIEPEWRFETDILKNAHEAMLVDGAGSVRCVREPVNTVDGITAAFDAITYQKGAAILAMVETTLGQEGFQKFVHEFLTTYAFKAIDSQDFTKALTRAKNGERAASILTSFVENPGLPVVRIVTDGSSTRVVQNRFLSKNQNPVPLWTISFGSTGTLAFHKENFAGYYIYDLSPAEWAKTLTEVPKMPRTQALAIAINFDLAFVGARISLDNYLDGVSAFAHHPDWEVAGFPIERLEFIEAEMASTSPAKLKVQQIIRDLYSPMLTKIGMTASLKSKDVKTWILELQREHLVEFFAASGADAERKAQLAKLGNALVKDKVGALDENDLVPADVIESALIAAAEAGGDAFLQKSIARFKATDDGHEREIWLHAIAASHAVSSSVEIEKLLLSRDIRNQEVSTLLFARAAVPAYRNETWNIVDQNTKALLARLDGDLEITLIQIADSFASEELARRVEATITPLLGNLRGGAVQLNQTLEHIRLNAAMVSRFDYSSSVQ